MKVPWEDGREHAASAFNQPLAGWNVSGVTDMSSMFDAAFSFNQPLASWDVSNVTNMDSMFFNTRSFNQPLNAWNVSNVTDGSDWRDSISCAKKHLNNTPDRRADQKNKTSHCTATGRVSGSI